VDEITRLMTATSNAVTAMSIDPRVALRANEILLELAMAEEGVDNVEDLLRPPEEEMPPEDEEIAMRIAASIMENARDGAVNWEQVAEWAVGELMES